MNVLDLFSGIGGFSLGLERAGMRTVAFCEIEPYCRAVLRKHWPDVPCYDNIRTLTAERLAADGITADVICGGFPCQDISTAGKGAGIEGERSGLWREYARLIGEIRPRFVIVENVAALLGRGLSRVLGDLATLGYDAEWHCIPASYVGAHHRRDRLWIVAYPRHMRRGNWTGSVESTLSETARLGADLADSITTGFQGFGIAESIDSGSIEGTRAVDASKSGSNVSDSASIGPSGSWESIKQFNEAPRITREAIEPLAERFRSEWSIEPELGRVANGIPHRAHRLRGLGNAVVPQIPEILGRAIMRAAA